MAKSGMPRKSLQSPTGPPGVLAAAVIWTKQLLITEESAAIEAGKEIGSGSKRRSIQLNSQTN
jgi:hypothetical protein